MASQTRSTLVTAGVLLLLFAAGTYVALDVAGRLSGLGEDPRTVTPREGRLGLLDLLDGVSRSGVQAWSESWIGWSPGRGRAPRLLCLWR